MILGKNESTIEVVADRVLNDITNKKHLQLCVSVASSKGAIVFVDNATSQLLRNALSHSAPTININFYTEIRLRAEIYALLLWRR